MKTPWKKLSWNFNEKFKEFSTHEANCWSCEDPAEFPPAHWVVTDHVLDSIVESLDAETPRNRDALEEDQEEKTETTDSVRIEDLEYVHSALRDTSEAYEVTDEANTTDEEFLAATEKLWPFVNHRSDETFHRTELWVEANQQQHEEEQTRPQRSSWQLQHRGWISKESETRTWLKSLLWFDANKRKMWFLPDAATSDTGRCCSCAMKPMTEKMTKPANIDVDEFTLQTISASLGG